MKTKRPTFNFKSDFFDDVEELIDARDQVVSHNRTRKQRLDMVRKFTNGQPLMSEEEAKKLNRKEFTNYLTNYAKLVTNDAMFAAMVVGQVDLLEIKVKTGNAERDTDTGVRLSSEINDGVINHKGLFAGFWSEICGHLVIGGGAPAVMPTKGWLPEVSLDLIFPAGTKLGTQKFLYCFEPRPLTYGELKRMKKGLEGRTTSNVYNVPALDALIQSLKRQIKDRIKEGRSYGEDEYTDEIREGSHIKQDRLQEIDAWTYYEVKIKDGKKYVSKTVFTDDKAAFNGYEDGDSGERPVDENSDMGVIVYHIEEAFPTVFDWCYNVFIDVEIGGKGTIGSLRGAAELLFPSGMEKEDLLNKSIEGDKLRAIPRFQAGDGANKQDILSWNIESSPLVPDGVTEFRMQGSSQQLLTPFGILDSNSAMLTGSPLSNHGGEGGELRQQAIERQQVGANVQAKRIAQAYTHLDSLLEVIVHRVLVADIKEEDEGYDEIMWVRNRLEEQFEANAVDGVKIDYKKIAEREHGRFKYLRVKAKRTVGNGDRNSQMAIADWMMKNIQDVEPAVRPYILGNAFSLYTGDPDLAAFAFRKPDIILNSQRTIAENEFDTMERRAVIGMTISPQPGDIHHSHIETHLIDAQALIGRAELRPWDTEDALVFTSLIQHIGEHIQILVANPTTNFEGTQYLQAFQEVVQQAKPLVADLQQRREDEAAGGLTTKEQADLELAAARLELDGQKLGFAMQKEASLQQSRDERSAGIRRKDAVAEITNAQRLAMEKEKIAIDKEARKDAAKAQAKTAKKTARKTAPKK